MEKPETEFYPSTMNKSKRSTMCKKCENLQSNRLRLAKDEQNEVILRGFENVMEVLGYDTLQPIHEQFKQRVFERYGVMVD